MKYLFLITAIWSVLTAAAQKPAGAGESKKMIEQVCAAAGKMQTLQCDFRQEKRLSLLETNMVSTGRMYYKGGKALKWEYVSPYAYTFLLNGDKVMLGSQGKTDVIQVNSSKTFKQIARIMMHSITGKCLSDTEDFHVTMLVEGKEWVAELIPRQKELAQLFARIRLHIDPKSQTATEVELTEKSGDLTRITMTNIKKNTPLDDALFHID